jgi:hypothetical protein
VSVDLATLGLVTTDHFEPFQRSMRVLVIAPVVSTPTAQQLRVLGQATARSARLVLTAPGDALADRGTAAAAAAAAMAPAARSLVRSRFIS